MYFSEIREKKNHAESGFENAAKEMNKKRKSKTKPGKPNKSHNAASLFSPDEDLELCRQVQRAMIPKSLPAIAGIDMKSLYFPCGAVGGDVFDVIHIKEDLLAFYMFDVARCGMSSALIAALAKASFSKHIQECSSPRFVLERVNAELIEHISANFYLTAFVGYLDLHDNRLTFCTAGHPYPILYRKKSDKLVSLRSPGTMLGVFDQGDYEDERCHLYQGDWFMLYTDGIYALASKNQEGQSRDAFKQVAMHYRHAPAALLENFQYAYQQMPQGERLTDDITALIVEILTQSRKNQIKEKLGFKKRDPVYLQFLSYYEEMDRVAGAVLRDMDAAGFPDELIRKMKITLTELLANAIGHGNNEDHSLKVTIGHMVEKKQASVAIMDEGKGFAPGDIPDPTLPENLAKDHGRGLYIVRNYVDAMEHNKKGNRILIRKFHAGA
jgi:serine phosphatase RsbU (regulator of sigma subunit)/anti-sigma regulatory factor (Ser/Thr protein kinase)